MCAIFEQLSPVKIKELAGRGIHVAILSAWMLFVLSNLVPVNVKANIRMLRGLSVRSLEDENENSDLD